MEEYKMTNVVFGINSEDLKKLNLTATSQEEKAINIRKSIDSILIFYEDQGIENIDLSQKSYEERERTYQELKKLMHQDGITIKENSSTVYSNSLEFKSLTKKIQKEEKNNAKTKSKKHHGVAKKVLATLGIAGMTATTAATAIMTPPAASGIELNLDDQDEDEDIITVPDINGKDWLFYEENGLQNGQKTAFVDHISAWLSATNVNVNEAWENVTLTDEQMEQYGFTDPECLYGFTAEDAYSLLLRFGHYTNEEYTTITGGNDIDVVSIMDDAHSMSNGALRKIVSYYVLSENCDLQIDQLVNFTDAEKAKIAEIVNLLREYKALEAEGKDQEAEDKMHEIKEWFNEYAQNIDFEQDNAKSYILRTILPACSTISQIHQYKDTITVTLYDTRTQSNVEKEVRTALFDEIMMRTLVQGFNETEGIGSFDAESFLEEHNISNSRYNLLNTDVGSSIADQSCGSQSERLQKANTYMSELRVENSAAEGQFMAEIKVNLTNGDITKQVADQFEGNNNVDTDYDKLTFGTYDPSILLEMLNDQLKNNNIYPKNDDYFNVIAIAEMSKAYTSTHGVTMGQVGDTIQGPKQEDVPVVEEQLAAPESTVLDSQENVTTAEQAMEEARETNVQSTGVLDASTPESEAIAVQQAETAAKNENARLQGIYDSTYAYYANGGQGEYNSEYANSSDSNEKQYYAAGKIDGQTYYNAVQSANQVTGGETVINPEFQDAEIYSTPQEPVPSVDNRTDDSENVVISTPTPTPEINYIPGMEDAEIVGDIIIGDQTPAETSTGEITTEVPESFAPVVDPSTITEPSGTITYFTEEEILNSFSDEEWEELITPAETSEVSSEEITK